MKKKLIALAVAGAMTAPMAAMADVKISGQLQSQIVSYGGDAGNRDGIYVSDGGSIGGSNAGSWGALNVVASEDLGNGLTALAKYAFNITTGGNPIGTREAYVGLAGGFGAVLAGRLNHPYKTATVSWDPFVATFMQARFNGGMGGTGAAQNVLHGSELDNALAYAGSFGGVKVVAAVVVDEGAKDGDNTKTQGKHATSFSVNAPVGPVEVAVGYINASQHADLAGALGVANANDLKNVSATKVGVKYAAGDFSVAGTYEMLDKGFSGAVDKKGNVAYLTGSYKMGANTISASFGQTSKELNDDDKAITYMAVGLSHAFSTKTNAFVGYRATNNIVVAGEHENESAFGAGLRVKF